MTPSFAVVVPVLDGARYLAEVLAALERELPGSEVLVIDSGSTDGSVAIARAAGATVLEIAKAEFGHGRTRNLGVERTTGDVVCFLTQDATPAPGWGAALREGFAIDSRIGVVFGPHLPRSDTPPMIARELTEFFAGFAPDGAPVVDGEPAWLSNVNAAYRRACWEEIRFADVAYSEDQAFANALRSTRWERAYVPAAAVLHAHDFGPVGFLRRYFDEYRGLRETSGHVERIGVRSTVRDTRAQVRADRAWMRDHDVAPGAVALWTVRGAAHHAGRKLFAALGSHAAALPAPVQRAISLEGRAAAPAADAPRVAVHRPASGRDRYGAIGRLARSGPEPLAEPVPGMADAPRLHIAVVIPPFRRGSGGHSTIFNLLTRLEDRGHLLTVWIDDPEGRQGTQGAAAVRGDLREFFRPLQGSVHLGLDDWYGADVALATGWDTVYTVLALPRTRARAYLVQDHEPEFFPTSAEALFAERTYHQGLHAITASPWLQDLVEQVYGGSATTFDLGVDHAVYRPWPTRRREDTVVFYARDVTPRRGVALGLLALAELKRRDPGVRIVLFGDSEPVDAPFAYEHLGIASPTQLARTYSEATVGLSLSLTNYSLIPQEMLACGLPCVELAGRSLEGVYGPEGPLSLTEADPVALADALERLLRDPGARERRAVAGLAFVASRTWDHAADQVEAGLRTALRRAEPGATAAPTAPANPDTPSAHASAEAARAVPIERMGGMPVTRRLYDRLRPEDVDAVQAALTPEQRALWSAAAPSHRDTLTLLLGAAHAVPGVLERTGLRPDEPPEYVHAMSRGPLAAAGNVYYADMLADAFERIGEDLAGVPRALDFGCSSGRVTRVLAAAYPDTAWTGMDPNAEAIAWAQAHLPGVTWAVSAAEPPLPLPADAGAFELVLAISIWSHYDEGLALRWLREIHRVLQPGGRLFLTAHGLQSVAHYSGTGERSPRQLADIRRELYRRGFWYAPEFGPTGDWGVQHPEWGTTFFTPEWLLRHATPRWEVEDYAVGRSEDNQDVYVLRRES